MHFDPEGEMAAHPDRAVAIVGLGYVGLTLAVVMADVGFQVLGVEIRDEVLESLAAGRAHFFESGMDDQIQAHVASGNLRFERELPVAKGTTVYVITVGTPIGPDKHTRIEAISTVATSIATRLRPGDMVVLRSTVRVGVTREVVKPILDQAGVPYDLAFCPERTIEGRALEELRTLPQIVGGIDAASRRRAAALFARVASAVVEVESLEAAELVKLINNTERDLRFAFANEIAAMCDVLGLSAHDVINASCHRYPRSNLARPGPVGGPCLTKDPYILAEGLLTHGLRPHLALAGRDTNEAVIGTAVRSVFNALRGLGNTGWTPRIAVLGLAFKGRPATDDLRGSTVFELLAAIRQCCPDATITGFDPVVPAAAIAELGVEPAASVEAAFAGSAVAFLHNDHPALAALPLARLGGLMRRPAIVYDFWGQNRDPSGLPDGVHLTGLGFWPAGLPAAGSNPLATYVA